MESRRNLFLIFKEAVNNIVKYADASKVSIHLSHEGSWLKLSINDNGRGFDTEVTLWWKWAKQHETQGCRNEGAAKDSINRWGRNKN